MQAKLIPNNLWHNICILAIKFYIGSSSSSVIMCYIRGNYCYMGTLLSSFESVTLVLIIVVIFTLEIVPNLSNHYATTVMNMNYVSFMLNKGS